MKVTVKNKLIAIFGIILFLLLFAALVSVHQLRTSSKTINYITEERKFIIKLIDLQATILDKNHSLLDIVLFGQNQQLFNRSLQEYQDHKAYIERLIDEILLDITILELNDSFPSAMQKFQQLYELEVEHLTRVLNTFRVGGKSAAVNIIKDSELNLLLEDLISDITISNSASFEKSLQAYRNGIVLAISIFLIAVILAVTIATKVGKKMISNIIYLTNSADEISLGSLESPIMLDSNDELGELADLFERLRLDIQKIMNQIHKS